MTFWTFWDAVKDKFLSTAQIRTFMPALLGAVATFMLNRWGIDVVGFFVDIFADAGITLSREAAIMFAVPAVTYVVYTIVSAIEEKNPNAGILLGARTGRPLYNAYLVDENEGLAVPSDSVEEVVVLPVDDAKVEVEEFNTLDGEHGS